MFNYFENSKTYGSMHWT